MHLKIWDLGQAKSPPELWHQLVITTKKQPELETAKTFLIRGFVYYTFYTIFVLVIQALT